MTVTVCCEEAVDETFGDSAMCPNCEEWVPYREVSNEELLDDDSE